MSVHVVGAAITRSAKDTVRLSIDQDSAAVWCANPAFQAKMKTLFVPLPIVLRPKTLCTERALVLPNVTATSPDG
jgi:hypothetical protein